MKFKFVVGIDVSKDWFNFCLMNEKLEIKEEGKVENTPEAIDAFLEALYSSGYFDDLDQILMIMEHTGIYVQHLANGWLGQAAQLTLVHASKVSNLLAGLASWDEKTDAMDARRLAEYAIRYSDKLKFWQAKKPSIQLLQGLQRQRSRTNDVINILEVPIKESKKFDPEIVYETLKANHSDPIKCLKIKLKEIDRQIKELIYKDKNLKKFFKLMLSVEGVGPVTATEVLIATSGFEDFLPNQAKAFARYCGVVPLQKQSGKVKRKARISKKANKKIKPLLTMGAIALIGNNSELGQYYDRKIKEGKKHFVVINAMRNKMILRMFAVVRNGIMYEKNLNLS